MTRDATQNPLDEVEPDWEWVPRRIKAAAEANRIGQTDVEAILRWRWRPFSRPSEEEDREFRRLKERGWIPTRNLTAWLRKKENAEKVNRYIASRLTVYGHNSSLLYAGDVSRMIATLRTVIHNWQEPDWLAVERLLVEQCGVHPLKLRRMDLAAIVTCLKNAGKNRRQEPNEDDLLLIGESGTGVSMLARWAEESKGIWLIQFRGQSARLKGKDGLLYYSWILQRPNSIPILSADLQHQLRSASTAPRPASSGVFDVVFDPKAKAAVQSLIRAKEDEIEVAESTGNLGLAASLRHEVVELQREFLKGMSTKRNRSRTLTRSPERKAHETVVKRLKAVRDDLAANGMQLLVTHLERNVTPEGGLAWSYRPDREVSWQFTPD